MRKNWFFARLALWMLLAVCFAFSMAGAEVYIDGEKPADWEERELLRIYAMRALDCDSYVLQCGGQAMLIDGGNAPKKKDLVTFLEERGISHLDMIYNSHPHDDHVEAIANAIADGTVTADVFLSPFRENYTYKFHKLAVKALQQREIPYRQLLNGEELTLGGAKLTLFRYDPDTQLPAGQSMTINNMSGVLLLHYGEASMLFTADIGGIIQQKLARDYGTEVLKADILTAPHHGKNAVNGELLKAVDPKLTIITGKVARTEDSRRQMEQAGIEWKRTSYGTITLETDGTDWYVTQEDPFGEVEKLRKQREKQQKK